MADRQLTLSLAFEANTSAAKQAIVDLANSLKQISTMPAVGTNIDIVSLNEGKQAAAELLQHLSKAVNVDTGKLNLATLATSLKSSGKSLNDYKIKLEQCGATGREAFLKISQSIANAENPLRRSNKLLSNFMATLKNTVKWQISSTLIHGFMGALQSAYGYAEDLNKSLTNIRIVTGQSIDKMSQFAQTANKAAKELSASTLAYTDAALIYYQQGLDDSAVKERTDATIKMMNVTGQNAEEVSSYMTAIWNNFDNGSHSLEYYADAITALGAATASSSKEIADGLQKFAAIADTVGLSYEYATAALATVVAETRQSADVVGTSFKTIFARMQGLSLGETLEDGVDLNKYSIALQKIGVDVLDANGNLRTMNDILDALGKRWETLTEAQRVATAETVGGVRQYANFMALMNNWSEVQKNITIAATSEGTLQKQADIYAQSWEGAKKRVQASLQNIYTKIIDDQFFINLTNGLSKIIEGIGGFLDGLGGVKGLIMLIANIFMQKYAKEVPQFLSRVKENLMIITGQGDKLAQQMRESNLANIRQEKANARAPQTDGNTQIGLNDTTSGSQEYVAQLTTLEKVQEAKINLSAVSSTLSESERQAAAANIELLEAEGQRIVKLGSAYDSAKVQAEKAFTSLETASTKNNKEVTKLTSKIEQTGKTLGRLQIQKKSLDSVRTGFKNLNKENAKTIKVTDQNKQSIQDMINKLKDLASRNPKLAEKLKLDQLQQQFKNGEISIEEFDNALKQASSTMQGQITRNTNNMRNALNEFGDDTEQAQQAASNYADSMIEVGKSSEISEEALSDYANKQQELPQHMVKNSELIISFGSALMSVSMTLDAFTRLKDVFTDEDSTAIEKITALIGFLTTAMSTASAVTNLYTLAKRKANVEDAKGLALKIKDKIATIAKAVADGIAAAATFVATAAQQGFNVAIESNPIGAIIVAIMALIAVLALLISTLIGVIKKEDESEQAAKRAEEAAAHLKEAYNETKQAYEDLKSSISDYHEARDALSELTKGTNEWREAITEANEKALELINNYEGLEYTIDENGLINIDEDSLRELQTQKSKEVRSAQVASMQADQRAKQARTQADQDKLKNSKHLLNKTTAGLGIAAAVLNPVAALPLLTAAGAASMVDASSDQKIDSAVNALTTGDLAEQFKNNELSDAELLQKLNLDVNDKELLESIKNLAKEINENTAAEQRANELAATTLLQDNATVQDSEYAEDIGVFAADAYGDAYDVEYQKQLEAAKSRGWFNTGNDDSKAAMEEYARNAGLDQLKNYKVTNYKGDGTIEYEYIDENGDKQKKTVTAEEIAATNAAKHAEDEVNEAGARIAKTLEDVDKTTEQQLLAHKKDDTSQLSINALNSTADLSSLDQQEMMDLGFNMKDWHFGMTEEEMREAFQKQLEEQNAAARQAMIDTAARYGGENSVVTQAITKAVNESDRAFANFTQEQINKYAGTLGQVMYAGGDAAAEAFNSGLEMLLTDHADNADQIMNIANSIDWTAADAMDQFNTQLAQAGIHIKEDSAAWQQLLNGVGQIKPRIEPRDYEAVRKQFIDLKSLAEKVKIGSIISDDDYEKLIAADKTLATMFTRTLEGYAYTGTEDLSAVVAQAFQKDTRDAMRQSMDMYKSVQTSAAMGEHTGYGWTTSEGWKKLDWKSAAAAVRGELTDSAGSSYSLGGDGFLKKLAESEDLEQILQAGGGVLDTESFKAIQARAANGGLTDEDKAKLAELFSNLQAAESTWSEEEMKSMTQEGLTQLGASFDSFGSGIDAMREMAQTYVEEGIFSQEDMDNLLEDATHSVANAAIMNAKSLTELNGVLNEIAQAGVDQDYSVISAALINLGSQYDNCTTEIENYQKALQGSSEDAMKAAEDQLRAAITIGEASEKYGLDANTVEIQAKALQSVNKDMNLSAEAAAHLAIANQRMNKGVDALSDNLEDWTKKLKKATRGSMDYAEVAAEVEGALKDLLGLSDNFELPEGFLDSKENLKLLEEAANGSQLAINKLGIQMVKGAMDITSWDQALIDAYNATAATDKTMSEFTMDMQTAFDTANAGMQAIQDNIVALTNGSMTLSQALDGVDLNEEDWITSLNEMAAATGMSVEEMRSMLNSMGVRANVEVDYVEQRTKVPTYTEVAEPGEEITYYDSEGQPQTRRGWKHYTVPGDPIEVKGSVPVPHISINDDDLAAHTISEKTISFSGVGGGKTGGGISHSKTTNGKKSGSSSSKEKKDKKSAEKETERYHEITALIEDYTRELDKAGKAKERAFGPKKLKAMQAEIAAQAQLNAATEEHIREIREWLEIDKARIAAQGATFDEYGNISNYTDLMQQHIDAYNAAVAAYNASEQSDADKEAMEAADKAYQDFIDQLSQYEETNDLLQDKLDELIEAQQAKYDREFEMLQYTIEFKIEADDSILSYLDYMKNKIENFNDGVHDAVEMLATLNDEAATLMDKNSTYNRAIDDTLNHYLSNQGMGESDIQAFIDRFKANNMSESDMSMLENMTEAEYQYLLGLKDNLLEINNSLIENMNAVVETVQNSFSKTAEDLDKATRPIERAASALENYAAIIDIVGRDALGITDAIAAELDNAAVAVAHSATVAAKAKVDTLQSERDKVQRLYDEAMAQGLTEMAYKWKTVLEEMDDEIAAATDDFNSKWQEELTKAREAFENTVERIKQSMLDAFAGSIGSWSGLKDSLEYAKTAADRFVPQYKEIYELSKLNRDIMKSIDNTSNIKNKQALRDLQKEINELEQHSGEISQYDLDNARRRYELELARLQLEEARDAKSTVRLSKDAEGNWSYVYTANQEDVEKAEQNYEDKLYAMQQANNEYINSLSDQILELEEQYAEKLAEIRLDNTMSEEERNAAIERLNAYFAEQMEYLTNEGQKAVDNNARLFEEEWTTYHNWTDAFGNDVQARIDNQHDFMTQFGDTILGTYTGYGNFDELNAAMVQIAEEASVKMEEAYRALQAQIATAMEAAGIDVAHFGEVVHDTVNDQIVPSAQAAEDAVVEMGKAAVDEFKELTDGVSTWQTKYATEMQKIINKNEQLATSVNNLATAYANLVAQMYAAADAPAPKVPKFGHGVTDGYINDDSDSSESGDFDDEGGGGATTPNWVRRQSRQKPLKDAAYKSYHETLWHDINGVKSDEWRDERHLWTGSPGIGGYSSATCDYCGMQVDLDPKKPYAIDDKGHILIPGYDTGGYTGNWNSSQGKLAVLHEKELVLNKDDTKNILGTVEMVRKLSQKIDLNAQTARYAFNYHPIINDPKPIDRELQVDQTVSITAEFPNVQNRTEIEEAFTTLINQASQFANRKS